MLFLIPLFASVLALGVAVYYFQRVVHVQHGTVEAQALANKVLKAARTHLFRVYGALTILILALSGVIAVIPVLGMGVALSFLIGALVSLGVIYFILLFFASLKARVAERASRGLLEAFHSTLEGGAFLSIFLLGAALLVLSAYYLTFRPLSITNVTGLAFGGILTTFLLKMTNTLYAHSAFAEETFAPPIHTDVPEQRNPETIVSLTGHFLNQGLSVVVDVFETVFLGLAGIMIAASFVFPGLVGAVALPFFLLAIGFMVSIASTRLIHLGATTALGKNILLVVGGSTALASLFSFPVFVWLIGGNVQYSTITLWGAAVIGFVSAGSIIVVWLLMKRSVLLQPWLAGLLLVFGSFDIALASMLADLYGVVIMLASFLSFGGMFVALNMLASISEGASAIGQATTPHQEDTKVLERLATRSPAVRGSIHVYLFLSALYVASVFFLLYQHIGITSADYFSHNPLTMVGSLLFGAGGLAFAVASMLFLQQRVKSDVHNSSRTLTKDARALPRKHSYLFFTHLLSHSTVRVILLPLCVVTIFPALSAFLGGITGLGGFLLGTLVAGSFWAATLIGKSETTSLNDSRENRQFTSEAVQPSLLAGILISTVKVVAVFSLLIVIFLI